MLSPPANQNNSRKILSHSKDKNAIDKSFDYFIFVSRFSAWLLAEKVRTNHTKNLKLIVKKI